MLFNSLHFLLFLPVVVLLYYSLPFRFRWILIFFASCYFYMAFIPKYILVLFLIIIIDFVSGIQMENNQGRKRKAWLIFSLVSNVGLLGFFKYFNFANENLVYIFSTFGAEIQPVNLDIILPVGLSFHTFQSMSYSIEVYRGNQKAERHIGYFANYVLFFPQMVAGPIERYATLGNRLRERHPFIYENLSAGFRLVLMGLFVKMAIADNIAPFVNEVYADPTRFGSLQILLAVIFFSFQIYADFFGYSTIALGAAKMLGVQIMDNFKTPYLSASVTEFWSRWHISLSTWFRDYLYIPLGGNRVPVARWCFNIMVVFMVSGLWHGASWTFVVWGALHGLMLLLEGSFRRLFGTRFSRAMSFLKPIMVLKTFMIVSVIWIFFRAENFSIARQMVSGLLQLRQGGHTETPTVVPLMACAAMFIMDLFIVNTRFDLRLSAYKPAMRWAVYSVLLFGLMALAGTEKFAFIYFQF